MDKAALSRASQHGVELLVRYEGRYPTGANGESLPSYVVAVDCAIDYRDEAGRENALADVRKFLTPAPVRDIEAMLAELSVIVAKRRDGEFDEMLRLEAYASRLKAYPADVVREALFGKTWQFWPTWAELERICNAKAAPRRHMERVLSTPKAPAEPERRPATQEERDRIQALVNEMFPGVSQEMRDRAFEEATKGNCMTGDAA